MDFYIVSVVVLAVAFTTAAADNQSWDKDGQDRLKTADIKGTNEHNIVGLKCFDNIALCIVKVDEKTFHAYHVDLKNNTLSDHVLTAYTLDRIIQVGEIYAKLYLEAKHDKINPFVNRNKNTNNEFFLKGSESKDVTEVLKKATHFWEIKEAKYAVLIKYEDKLFGFATCAYIQAFVGGKVSQTAKELVVLGFSQKSNTEDIAKRALLKYLCHKDAFGEITYLESFYSGYEQEAKGAIKGTIETISKTVANRRELKENEVEIDVLNSWSVAEKSKCIGFCSCQLKNVANGALQYFFVIYDSTFSGDSLTLTKERLISVLGPTEYSTMMALVDHLKPNYISHEIDEFTIKEGLSPAAKLIYAADFAARTFSHRNRDGADKIPHINHLFAVAKNVVDRAGEKSWKIFASIFLKDTLSGTDISESKFVKKFGQEVQRLVKSEIDVSSTWPLTEDSECFVNFNMLRSAKYSFIEGKPMNHVGQGLLDLLQKRIVKVYKKKKIAIVPTFVVSLNKTYSRDNVNYGIYKLTESPGKTYYFSIELSNPKGEMIVGELHEDIISLTTLNEVDHGIAEKYTKLIGDGWKSAKVKVERNVAKLVKCLEYAARKHFAEYQRRKDSGKGPYINHTIGVARILIHEAGLDDIDLILAAILHDTIENTTATEEELTSLFEETVAKIVMEVSDDTSPSNSEAAGAGAEAEKVPTTAGPSPADKKEAQKEKAKNQSPLAALLKLADKINNLRDFGRQRAPGYAEAMRRWQFTNSRGHLEAYKWNFDNNLANWNAAGEQSKQGFKKLFGILKGIIDDFAACTESGVVV